MNDFTKKIIQSRRHLIENSPGSFEKPAEEGGCGVVGFAVSEPVSGRHIFEPSIQMHNRGNGKGGGIACASLSHEQLGVSEDTLKNDYILQIALLEPASENDVEKEYITPFFNVSHKQKVEPAADWQELGMPVAPPDIVRFFVRAKEDELQKFAEEKGLSNLAPREIEDEFVYQNSVKLNQTFYASLGEKRAFVLSHSRNLMIFKVVGYAEHVVQYYGLEDFKARIWIAHQRYPTKGRVWHPAGSHPFIGMNEALVHNGDFANYHSVTEYLIQHNIYPQFLTDTEVSALLFDLLNRTYKYPQEYIIEAMAPTTEHDFDQLPADKQKIYRAIQALHMHGSPDGPWFFIIARSNPDKDIYNLLGITDTAMLRPQVFAIQEGDVSIGLVGSEKQAIDATLSSLNSEDPRLGLVADRYWNARGGSYNDGGAFSFNVVKDGGEYKLTCEDKFGSPITAPEGEYKIDLDTAPSAPSGADDLIKKIEDNLSDNNTLDSFFAITEAAGSCSLDEFRWVADQIVKMAGNGDKQLSGAIELLTLLNDRKFNPGKMRRSAILQIVRKAINAVLDAVPSIGSGGPGSHKRIDWDSREKLRAPTADEKSLVIYSKDFPPEGDDNDARLAVNAYELGWKHFIHYGLKGQRFHGCGLGANSKGVRFDLYGASGDYTGSGMDGVEIHIHDNAQDQLCQIAKDGKMVIYGDVGQAFMYGGKGGAIYVMGNGAGRPLINGVGRPKVVINGTCLDFLAESFMAGDPHKNGGFVILNAIKFDDQGKVVALEAPYPGSNLFSLASGGAIFVRDPHNKLVDEQLNGAEYAEVTDKDWRLILPQLQENEKLFGISIEDDLLTVDGEKKSPSEVYRKVIPKKNGGPFKGKRPGLVIINYCQRHGTSPCLFS